MPVLDQLLGIDGVDAGVDEADAVLTALLDGDDSPAGAPSRRVAAAGGKRIRPALVIACARLGTPEWDAVVNGCVAVELVQVGSLVHDDILEKADTRRGIPTINAVEGENHALMAGDYILARAAEAAAGSAPGVAAAVAKTVEELCLGQILEMGDLYDTSRTIDAHLDSIARKTASLFACSCRVGGLCAGIDRADLEALATFGRAYGMAYQILDDVFDLISTTERLGKPANIDILSGVYTLPVLLALKEDPVLRAMLEDRDHEGARRAVIASGTIDLALDHARHHARGARRVLAGHAIAQFPERYVDWALGQFA